MMMKNVGSKILHPILSTENNKGEWQDLHAKILRAPNHRQHEFPNYNKYEFVESER